MHKKTRSQLFLSALFLAAPFFLEARKVAFPADHPDYEGPYFTGPLVAPSSLVLPYPHINFEPYINIVVNTGEYDGNWSAKKNAHPFYANSLLPLAQFGLTSYMDFQIAPQLFYNYTDGVGTWVFGDITASLDLQLFDPDLDSPWGWFPSIKLSLKEVLPTGKYHKLDPKKKGTDVGGNGSFATSAGIVFGKLIHLRGIYFMTVRFLMQYTIPAAVRLKGYNVYGGGRGTNVKFFPAQSAFLNLGLEFTLAQNWAFACDFVGNWAKGSNYSGSPGIGIDTVDFSGGGGGEGIGFLTETPAKVGSGGPSWQYSIAPAIEYNWSENLGIIAGSWFTIAGKNSVQFYSGIVAINYYH